MRRTLTVLAASAAFAAVGVLPSTASADPAGICPDDHFIPVPAMSQADFNKDNNHDGMVCKKPRDPKTVTAADLASGDVLQGGPDDKGFPTYFEIRDDILI